VSDRRLSATAGRLSYWLVVRSLLGLRLEVDRMHVARCLPAHWNGLTIRYRFRETVYHIAVAHTRDVCERDATHVTVDGVEQAGQVITLVENHRDNRVDVRYRTTAAAMAK
jgi:cellobiose phosphorylase